MRDVRRGRVEKKFSKVVSALVVGVRTAQDVSGEGCSLGTKIQSRGRNPSFKPHQTARGREIFSNEFGSKKKKRNVFQRTSQGNQKEGRREVIWGVKGRDQ